MEIDAHTTLCAVIGHPVRHSVSPAMHNAAYREMGLNWVYTAFDVTDVGAALAGVRGLGIRGLSVTIPHKVTVMEHVDELDPLAKAIGAVNTVINHDGHLIGANTDGFGAMQALSAITDPHERSVLILGSGGAARAVAFTMAKECRCKRMVIQGVIPGEMQALAREVSDYAGIAVETDDFTEHALCKHIAEAEIVFNTTPVGMEPDVDSSPAPAGAFYEGQVAFDLVYKPAVTKFMREAEAAGAVTLNGLPMLIHQGAEQIRCWSGREPSIEVMTKAGLAASGVET